jgi:small neutral amino acid transporter SnatA (MarC family)
MRVYNGTNSKKVSLPTAQPASAGTSRVSALVVPNKSGGFPRWAVILIISIIVMLLIYGVWRCTRKKKDFGFRFY